MPYTLLEIIEYFLRDPMRLIALIGGSGGIVYWFDRFRNRPRLRVRVLNAGKDFLHLEAESLSLTANSLAPSVRVTGYDVLRRRIVHILRVGESDRALPPYTPRRFTAGTSERLELMQRVNHLMYATVVVQGSRGRPERQRFRRLYPMVPVGVFGFVSGLLPFFVRGKYLMWRGARAFKELAEQQEAERAAAAGEDWPKPVPGRTADPS